MHFVSFILTVSSLIKLHRSSYLCSHLFIMLYYKKYGTIWLLLKLFSNQNLFICAQMLHAASQLTSFSFRIRLHFSYSLFYTKTHNKASSITNTKVCINRFLRELITTLLIMILHVIKFVVNVFLVKAYSLRTLVISSLVFLLFLLSVFYLFFIVFHVLCFY